MKWYFEHPGNMDYLENEEPQHTGEPTDYDYHFSDSLHRAAHELGTNLWVRDKARNYLVWECQPQGTHAVSDELDERPSPNLTNTIEYQRFALRFLAVARPFWEQVAGEHPTLQKAIKTEKEWMEGSASNDERNEARKACEAIATDYPEGIMRAYPDGILWFCSPYRDTLIHQPLGRFLEFAHLNLSAWQERTWAEIFIQRLEDMQSLSEQQEFGLHCLQSVLESVPAPRPSRQFTGLWQVGSSEPLENMYVSVLTVAQQDQPNLFFTTGGRTELVCRIESIVHAFRHREIEMLLKTWNTPSQNRDHVVAALDAYQEWFSGQITPSAFLASIGQVTAHLPDDSTIDLEADDEEEQEEEDAEEQLATFLTRAVSELSPDLSTFPFIYHMVLRDAHAELNGEKSGEMTPNGEIVSYTTTMDRLLTEWFVRNVSGAINSTPDTSDVQNAALRQLHAELREG